MRRLSRAVRTAGASAPSLPNMYPSLAERGVSVRTGECSMIAGPPASGKSMLALSLAVRAEVETIYLSADSHLQTQSMRVLSMLTDTEQQIVEQTMINDKDWAAEVLKRADHIRWSFHSAPSATDIEAEVLAHVELTSRAPELFIVDNLTDCVVDGEEWSGARSFLKDMKYLAREYSMAMLVLHHTSEGVQVPAGTCPPRYSVQGKVAQTPALLMTVSHDPSGYLGVCPVKNRYGPSNPSGSDPTWFAYMPSKCQVIEVPGQELLHV